VIIRALQETGYLDLSNNVNDTTKLDSLRVALAPQQSIEVDDNYTEVLSIQNAISSGLLEVVSYSATGETLANKIIQSYGESVVSLSGSSGTILIDLSLGNVFTGTFDDAVTFSFTNAKSSGIATSFILIATFDGTISATWPNYVHWPSATAPSLTADGTDILTFMTVNGGTVWYGTMSQSNTSI